MSGVWARVGYRVTIVTMEHSPRSTLTYGSMLLGREGVVVALLRNTKVALVKLDESYELPQGTRRWPVAWDDLVLGERAGVPDVSVQTYVAGFSKAGRALEQHAVLPGTDVAVCSSPVKPLPFCGWSLSFSPTVPQACPKCVMLVEGSQLEGRGGSAMPVPSGS
ncbi:hypothetical protein ACIBI9_52030 [Nonomuraea sp. NPDC050451]|uniref:hypothetical protein n=1 Tax=Nonomuraea sp. NPDC050451 TaxID=3364364 RepID=UPI0037A61441